MIPHTRKTQRYTEAARNHPDVKMLALVVVLFVAVGVSDGMILTKCELKQQLERGLSLKNFNSANVLAQIVCHAEKTSNFNTSAIKTVTEPQEPHSVRAVRRAKKTGSSSNNESNESKDEVWTLYGLFQLSDLVACNSTQSGALDLCKMSCSKLIDDNISDDIACVQTIITELIVRANHYATREILEMLSLTHQQECKNLKPSLYFSGC